MSIAHPLFYVSWIQHKSDIIFNYRYVKESSVWRGGRRNQAFLSGERKGGGTSKINQGDEVDRQSEGMSEVSTTNRVCVQTKLMG